MTIITASAAANRRASATAILLLALAGAALGGTLGYLALAKSMTSGERQVATPLYILKHNLSRTPASTTEMRYNRAHAETYAPRLAAYFDRFPGVVGASALAGALLLPVFVSGAVSAARSRRRARDSR